MKPTNVRQLLLSLKREGLIKSASYGKYVLTSPQAGASEWQLRCREDGHVKTD
jgi:hypothetical protein